MHHTPDVCAGGCQRIAGHTRTSMLRLNGESHGWMLPETEDFMNRQIEKSMEAYKGKTMM